MTDRELLELAAKAVYGDFGGQMVSGGWNPLEDDGESLRLAVKLGMNIDVGVNPVGFTAAAVIADYNSVFVDEYHNEDPMTATRRAIVRAAAAIGEAM